MECKDVKAIIPAYVKQQASSQEVASIEEHLCTCNDCRQYLGGLMNEETPAPATEGITQPAPVEPEKDKTAFVEEEKNKAQPGIDKDKNKPKKQETAPRKQSSSGGLSLLDFFILGVGILALIFFLLIFSRS